MPEDRVTAALEEIRDLDRTWARPRSPDDVLRLLAAIDGVLKLADSAHIMLANHETGHREPVAWDLDPEDVREAISSALTGSQTAPAGEGSGDG